ncbi:hypothetical protein GTW43_26160 [Streptomyces sp. SID5785]|uniref:hypothetical protein n=1 Tax=Streptomyces sp. SID5785 TaxID=2690309 RepID=UPI001361B47D|nr:hypothetical protein [Streptomyces sp. SID5785]MZD08537.1 hypothetical protein [Streptomyces sp. SID5785]
MDERQRQQGPSGHTRYNWWLPMAYAAAVGLTSMAGNDRATGIVAAAGGILLGLYYGFGARLSRGRR